MIEMLSSEVLLDGKSKIVKEILNELNLRIIKADDAMKHSNMPNMYCVISPYLDLEANQEIDVDLFCNHIESIMQAMIGKKEGRCVLIINGLLDKMVAKKWIGARSKQAAIISFWKYLAIKLAPYKITCNIISLGYTSFSKNAILADSQEFIRHLAIRRPVYKEDLKNGLQFLLSKNISYVVGQILALDGGLGLNQIPATLNKMHHKKVLEQHEQITSRDDLFDLTGHTAIIIGSSSGIGRETALELARRGANIVLVARNVEKLNQVYNKIKALGNKCMVIPTDVTNKDQLAEAIQQAVNEMVKVDIMVYAAGYVSVQKELDKSDEWDKMFKVNFEGYVAACRVLAERWRSEGIKGTIVGISSVDALVVPSSDLEAYSASKAALSQFSRSLALTYSRYGIRVNCVFPGNVKTAMTEWIDEAYIERWIQHIPMHRLGTTLEIASVIAFLASPASAYITGEYIIADGGYILGGIPQLHIEGNEENEK